MSNHHQLSTRAGTPAGGCAPTTKPSLRCRWPRNRRSRRDMQPRPTPPRDDVVKAALQTTPASEISMVDLAEVVTTDDHPDWRREDEPVASMCLAEVRVFFERYWCRWWQ